MRVVRRRTGVINATPTPRHHPSGARETVHSLVLPIGIVEDLVYPHGSQVRALTGIGASNISSPLLSLFKSPRCTELRV